MGTGTPPVTVRAATLAGGEKNQDRYAYGDGWAFVLDGASSFATEQPEHDGGWYAERLKNALVDELTSHPDDATTHIVARAIEVAASAHSNPETCPTSTIAMARWSPEAVDVYVLGDSTVALVRADGEATFSDSRLADIAGSVRSEYRSRLSEGTGFDDRHRELLARLQSHQAASRNRPHGYWIAGADPDAANHGLRETQDRDSLSSVVLATDGAAAGIPYDAFPTWATFAMHDPHEILRRVHEVESGDPYGARWPRSKAHDDKTAITVRFAAN